MGSREHHEDTLQPFCDVLVDLTAGLAILEVVQRQQNAPSSTMTDGQIKKFGGILGCDLAEDTGIPLADILWAFSLIFSPSRNGTYVVASVLGEEPQHNDTKLQRFTLYLTNNRGFWSDDDRENKGKWEAAVNRKKTDISSLWLGLTQHCEERMRDYAESAQGSLLGEPRTKKAETCKKTHANFDIWGRSSRATDFPSDLSDLLGQIRDASKPDSSNMDTWKLLAQECWQFLEDHGDQFGKLIACPLKGRIQLKDTELTLDNPQRARLFLRAIESLAKLPRALYIFKKFRDVLISKKAHFEIKLIPARPSVPTVFLNPSGLVTQTVIDEAREKIERLSHHPPHCEIQMLQYLDGDGIDKSNIWNVMGCSKRPCLACAPLLEASYFLFQGSHGKAYPQQFLLAAEWLESNPDMNSGVRKLKDDVDQRIGRYKLGEKGRRNEVPDSPTCLDWSILSNEEHKLFDTRKARGCQFLRIWGIIMKWKNLKETRNPTQT